MTSTRLTGRVGRLLRLWFGFRTPVRRGVYAASGVVLAGAKFLGDLYLVERFTYHSWSPLSYINPYFFESMVGFATVDWIVYVMAAWTIPFLWIGASMTFRRVRDAGLPPLLGALFFFPLLNYLVMLILCLLPSRSGPQASVSNAAEPDRRTAWVSLSDDVIAGIVGVSAGAGCLWLAIAFGNYGVGLFLGTPFMLGALTGWAMNRRVLCTVSHTSVVVQGSVWLCMFGLIAFGFEGAICVVMAYPLAGLVSWLGGLVGREMGRSTASRLAIMPLIVFVPSLYGIESNWPEPSQREVVTTIEIAAPSSVVWKNVIAFPPLPPPHELIFKLGVSCPQSAFIAQKDEGMIRYCVFTTGSFVEPITVWDPPNRLAFEVVDQPPSMKELSPYDSVFPDHLLEGVVSRHGEFRIIEIDGGRVRLEGRTAYSLNFKPGFYWGWWSDFMIHTIHRRVLDHIRALSEREHAEVSASVPGT